MFGNDLRLDSNDNDPRSRSGVYFLWRGGRIVYVGQAMCVLSRAADHCIDKSFDRSSFIRIKPSDLDFVESYLIWFLRPEMNKQVPILGRISPYSRGRISVCAKAVIIAVLESLPDDYVLGRFMEAESRESNTCGNQQRQQKRRRMNKSMRQMFAAGLNQGAINGTAQG